MSDDDQQAPPAKKEAKLGVPTAELPWALEAMLFASGEPQNISSLSKAVGAGEGTVRKALRQLADDYEARGLRLVDDGAGMFEIVHAPNYAASVERLLGSTPAQRLSRAALETLAIVAWRQPCTRSQVEAIRGVNSDRLIGMLESRGLLENTGQADTPGRPKLYRTTLQFFEHFGLGGPSDLPPLSDEDEAEDIDI